MWEHVGIDEEPTFLVFTPEIPDLPRSGSSCAASCAFPDG